MLDIRIIREKPEDVKKRLLDKGVDCREAIDRILELDTQRRNLIGQAEALKAEQNRASKQIPIMKKQGQDTTALFAQMKELSDQVKQADAKSKEIDEEYRTLMLPLPNLPDPDLKPGGKENNEPLRYFGEPHKFDFEPKNHVELCTDLGLIDYPRGVKLAGNGFWIYKGMGARLEWALLNYFIDTHLADGYEFILPPHMLEYECGLTAGQFPKFEDDVYWLETAEGLKLHCWFLSGSPNYYEKVYTANLRKAAYAGGVLTVTDLRDSLGFPLQSLKELRLTFSTDSAVMELDADESKLAGGAGDNLLSGSYRFVPWDKPCTPPAESKNVEPFGDLILSGTYFGEGKNRPVDIVTNHVTYYIAQFVIAGSLLLF